jgi:hypothetical protein
LPKPSFVSASGSSKRRSPGKADFFSP